MSQQRNAQLAYTEGDIILVISNITSNQALSVKRAAVTGWGLRVLGYVKTSASEPERKGVL
jgi:hypothetical protein